MDIHHLRHLIAVAEHQSFRKAADALCITQPALSRSLQALEQELGVRLIDRQGRRNAPTAAMKELTRSVELLKRADLGSIAVGFGPTPAAILMQPFLARMTCDHPRLQVRIARGAVDLLVQALRNEAIDIAIVDQRALTPADDLTIEPAGRLRGGFLCRADHPLTRSPLLTLDALREFPVASTPLSDELARLLVDQLGPDADPTTGLPVRHRFSSEGEAVGRGLVAYKHAFNDSVAFVDTLLVEAGSDNTFVQNDAGLQVDMSKKLALKVGYQVRHNTDVAPGIKKTDQLMTTNLVYNFAQ